MASGPRRGRLVGFVVLVGLVFGSVQAAWGVDLTASWDGSFPVKKARRTDAVAGAFTQTGVSVTGTLAFESVDAAVSGVYSVTGVAKGKKLRLSGVNGSGTRFKWAGTVGDGSTLKGKAQLRAGGKVLKAALRLTRRNAEPPSQPREACDNSFFTGQVTGRVLQPVCAACHVAGGSAQASNFRVNLSDPLATQNSIAALIDFGNPDNSRILLKPTAQLPHGGVQQLLASSDEFGILKQWVQLVAAGQQCAAGGGNVSLVPIPANQLLVRASMDLRGRRPAPGELDAVEADANAYPALVDQYLHTPEFLERVKDVYDDAMLVRREDFTDEARDKTAAIYGEAIELISYIVKNDRPFSELGTADYTVANQLFQSDVNRMPFSMDPVTGSEWQPTHYTDGRPHAGLLSTSAFYEVWDTNDTNKNRRRANRWSIMFHCYNFLDTPVDVTRNVDNNDANAVLNAVTTRADCKACHDRLDPMASFLFRMDNAGLDGDAGPTDFFSGNPERWRTANRRPPAVYGAPGTDIRDEGRLLVANPKFAECQTKRAFKMLFLRDPQTNDELAAAADISARWPSEDGYNFRSLVRRWMLSDVYKGRPDTNDPAWVRRTSPERLENLLQDLTGFVWSRDPQNDEDDNDPNSDPPRIAPVPLLTTEEDGFKIILGGVNGVSVSGRSSSLNASVAMVQRKVAALAADYVVTNDLATADGYRHLLNGVTGAETIAEEAAVRAAISRIARRLYGEQYAADSAQVGVWWSLYRNLYNDTTQGGTGNNQVPGTRSERAWRGLITAMLRSPRILLY